VVNDRVIQFEIVSVSGKGREDPQDPRSAGDKEAGRDANVEPAI